MGGGGVKEDPGNGRHQGGGAGGGDPLQSALWFGFLFFIQPGSDVVCRVFFSLSEVTSVGGPVNLSIVSVLLSLPGSDPLRVSAGVFTHLIQLRRTLIVPTHFSSNLLRINLCH